MRPRTAKGKPPVRKLQELRIGGNPVDWQNIGFLIENSNCIFLENVAIVLVPGKEFVGWSFETYPAHHGDMLFSLDGISTCLISPRDEDRSGHTRPISTHPNHAKSLSKIIIHSFDLNRTMGAMMGMLELTLRYRQPDSVVLTNQDSGILIEIVKVDKETSCGIVGLAFESQFSKQTCVGKLKIGFGVERMATARL
jgi:hypothetical protein